MAESVSRRWRAAGPTPLTGTAEPRPPRSLADLPTPAARAEGVSVVIPAFDEEQGIGEVIGDLVAVLGGPTCAGLEWEILVVDDGSRDGTADAVAPWVGARVSLLRHERNLGYGRSIKTGIRRARHPWVLIIDADGTYPAEHIPALLARRADHAMVVGARVEAGAQDPWLRRPPKWALRKLACVLSGQAIPDLNSGLRVFRKELAVQVEEQLSERFSYTSTITLALSATGHRIGYVPIGYRRRKGKSKIRPIADTARFFLLIVRTMAHFGLRGR